MNPAANKTEIFTIGHSNHELPRFTALLKQHRIDVLTDVRSQPYSQFNPQYNRETLATSLKNIDINYIFLGTELGARRNERECYIHGKAIRHKPRHTDTTGQIRKSQQRRSALTCCY